MTGNTYVGAREHKVLCLKCAAKHGIDMADIGSDRISAQELKRMGIEDFRCTDCRGKLIQKRSA